MREHRRSTVLALAAVPIVSGLFLAGCSASTADDDAAPAAANDAPLYDLLPADVQEAGVISFGALWETPPTIGVDPADPNTPVGFAPDVAAAMGEQLGVDVEWQNLQWPAQLPGVQSGSVDALFGQVSITEERETSIVDLVTFQVSDYAVLTRGEDDGAFARLDEMCGLNIAVPVGATQVEYVSAASDRCEEAGEPAIEMTEYQGATAALQALRAGTVDAWINGEDEQAQAVANNGDEFAMFTAGSDELPPSMAGIAVGKDQPELTEAIYEALGALIDDGTYDELIEEWGLVGGITRDELAINPITETPVGEIAD
ncbi:transporter substrate-binding domain-containing protein [Microbacterium sp. ZXX196]|uniref:transporter substrate-binding domain-containing protein n=1 Tax=Microbacterium sp. ZXX196 TaxID=2609291 RepID=UPI0012B84140|nr:transporter substrate-binding domain-containing protein [Microbacterium sp. ZXX196]MTE24233.1 transporter substrate-binding domain-containing protein [Microbacterium sp. ZXX196]